MVERLKEIAPRQVIHMGCWTREGLERILRKTQNLRRVGHIIDVISRQFLGTSYGEGTLIGSSNTLEELVVDLSRVDCFTFLDYVEAARLSDSWLSFVQNLVRIRYHSDAVTFWNRNHFFSDWSVFNGDTIEDVTQKIGGARTKCVRKTLNMKADGTLYVPGIRPVAREIRYVPSQFVGPSSVARCRTGDYIGIYADDSGLDVSHVGIFIRSKGTAYLRHASSHPQFRQVIDQDFPAYMADKPGFLVLRPKNPKL